MAHYESLGANLEGLDDAGLLRRIKEPVDKDTELMPLVRCQFQGLPEEKRTAWLFENVTDANGTEYDMPVAVSTLGASRDVYRFNLGCETDADLFEKWESALDHPIETEAVEDSPVKDIVVEGEDLVEGEGVDKFPVPISTPGFDPAPFFTSAFVLTRDPETGVANLGTYRCHLKSHDQFGVYAGSTQDLSAHWDKAVERGEPLETAIVLGAPPHVGMVSVSKVPHGTNELEVSGGLIDQPLEVVDCETVDLQVPACAEIVIEGELTQETHPEGPFGEFTGYMGDDTESPNFEVSCLTHRDSPVYQAFISQMPPSESSTIRKVGYEQNLLRHLRQTNITNVQDVVMHQYSGSFYFLVVQLDKNIHEEPFQALNAIMGYTPTIGKFTVAVDEDINPHDLQSVLWAMSFRVQPHRDIEIVKNRRGPLDPSSAPEKHRGNRKGSMDPRDIPFDATNKGDSALLVDATVPWDDYPPIALPAEKYMQDAVDRWDEFGFEELNLTAPWYGVSLGDWSEQKAKAAAAATNGDYFDGAFEHLTED